MSRPASRMGFCFFSSSSGVRVMPAARARFNHYTRSRSVGIARGDSRTARIWSTLLWSSGFTLLIGTAPRFQSKVIRSHR